MTRMTAARYLAESFESYGVSSVFLVPTILSKTLYEIEQHTGVKRVVTHGEKAAAYMADGYARASGGPGVCMAQIVGAANLAAGLQDPYLGCSPVVALTGGPFEHSQGRAFYQEIEAYPLFKPVTKFSAKVNTAGRLPDLLAQAFHRAVSGRPGPTHLEVSGHSGVALEEQEWDFEPAGTLPPKTRPVPDAESVRAAVHLLSEARRPVIVAGGGVRASGAVRELVELAERLGIPVATSLNGKDALPASHPLNAGVPGLYARNSANQVILEADIVFFVGSQAGSQVTLNWQVPGPGARVIQLDIEAESIGRHYRDTLPLHGDAKAGLLALRAAAGDEPGAPSRADWLARVSTLKSRWEEEFASLLGSDDIPLRPERLCSELTQALPGNSILMSDTGHSGMWTGGMVDLLHSGQRYLRAAGSLGWGLPASIGAQLAVPNRPVVLFTGDGGLWYHLAELETAARWKVPVTVVVNNNRSLNQEIRPYSEAYGGRLHGRHAELWHFQDLKLAEVAESMGVRGYTVTKGAEFPRALDQALSGEGPALIDVVTEIEAMAPRGSGSPAADRPA